MCNEQTGLNYQATVENQNKINELEKQLRDKDVLIEETIESLRNQVHRLEDTIRKLDQEIDMIKFRERHPR